MSVRMRIIPVAGILVFILISALGARFASETAQASTELGGTVYWSDGSSGRLSDGTRFRLHGIDAPETGATTQRGGAKCEAERELGYDAKAAAVELTRGRQVVVTEIVSRDRYGRNVLRLSLDGRDVGEMLVESGMHKVWNSDSREPKPDWCTPVRRTPLPRAASL
ncbi:thermonuclease family protein [Hyphomonas sp.]|uniref:thermonuclease family protein n=1 Tax=Hyphomonas sp. TaxID=87 RepID=UPI00391C22B9